MGTNENNIFDYSNNDLASTVFNRKYALRDDKLNLLENCYLDTVQRLVNEMVDIEIKYNKNSDMIDALRNEYLELLSMGYFIPGGRILYALGNKYTTGTLSNCYYIPIKDDSINSIWDAMKEMAITYSYGGGCGTDISALRPKGAKVSNSAKFSTGSTSFMELYSDTTNVIGQSGRRGALLISIRVDHPDIEDFITIKNDNSKIKYANISVKCTDEFMHAVESDGFFNLYFQTKHETINKTIKARELWTKLCTNARNKAEPGLLFWDTIKKESPSEFNDELRLTGVNPCAEATLGNYGSCNLGSIFLNRFVKNPFTDNAYFDFETLKKAIYLSVRFLDNIVTINCDKHPLYEQRKIDELGRRIGLGISGLADMFAMLNIKYDSNEALDFSEKLFEFFRNEAYRSSINLSKERGPFRAYNQNYLTTSSFIKRLPLDILDDIHKYGIRNVSILSVAPTGSISIIAQASSGIEPIFSLYYNRDTIDQENNTINSYEQYHPLLPLYFEKDQYDSAKKVKDLKKQFNLREAHEVDWRFRIKLQAIIQKYVDASISSTINLPEDTTVETIEQIYMDAWKQGLKGITVYRDKSRENVISVKNPKLTKRKAVDKEFMKSFMMLMNSYMKTIEEIDNEEKPDITKTVQEKQNYLMCPQCKSRTLVNNSGCTHCINPTCGYGECNI